MDAIQAAGTLRANEAVVISPEVTGRIDRTRVRESTRIQLGDVLVGLDASVLWAEPVKRAV